MIQNLSNGSGGTLLVIVALGGLIILFGLPALIRGRFVLPRRRYSSSNDVLEGPGTRTVGLFLLISGLIVIGSGLLGVAINSPVFFWGGALGGTIIFFMTWTIAANRARRGQTSRTQLQKKPSILKIPMLILAIGLVFLGFYLWNTSGNQIAFAVVALLAAILFFIFLGFQLVETIG